MVGYDLAEGSDPRRLSDVFAASGVGTLSVYDGVLERTGRKCHVQRLALYLPALPHDLDIESSESFVENGARRRRDRQGVAR